VEINGDYKLKAPPELVWSKIMDREILEKALPGCEKLLQISPEEYEATLKIGVASIKGTYNGILRLTEVQKPFHYILSIEGGGTHSHLNGQAVFDFEEFDAGNKLYTLVKYKGVVHIGGKLADIGTRMLSPLAKLLIGNFFKSIEKQPYNQDTLNKEAVNPGIQS